jgi:hypothetical protein
MLAVVGLPALTLIAVAGSMLWAAVGIQTASYRPLLIFSAS